MSNYLDVNKSVIISSPAGSGKTEKLARRYIALLKSGVDVERILAITFTDKAAAEMKHRILRILGDEDEELFRRLVEKMSLMRVSTIHSFCGNLLRRFSFEASLDPNYRIEDEIDSRIAWDRVFYEVLMEAGEGKAGYDLLLQTLSEKGFRGLEYLKSTINNLFEKRPFSLEAEIPGSEPSSPVLALAEELRDWTGAGEAIENYGKLFESGDFSGLAAAEKYFLTTARSPRKRAPEYLKGIVDYQDWALKMFLYWNEKNREEFKKRAERIKQIFSICYSRYSNKKALNRVLDYSDLEYITYSLLTQNPEWSNILYAFDEKTDHVLVDEFQDTNNFQWGIIDKLTEEWRSGIGAKREEGTVPTIFLVGDEKQSIYFFRGANVEIFNRAKKKLDEWLKDEFYYEEVTENFRSLPAIVDFTNHVFSKIMTADKDSPPWMTRYSPFQPCRTDTEDTGRVELILLDVDESTTAETRQKEADVIAKRIQSLVDDFHIADRSAAEQGVSRPCRYLDIALLLRKRTHLKKYEEAFRRHNIPFVAVKGIGFYQETEVAILRALVYFLTNPHDDYSLYILLKSPFFLVDESVVVRAMGTEDRRMSLSPEEDSLFSKLRKSGQADSAVNFLDEWLLKIQHAPLSELIEESLSQTKAWEFFCEAQRKANVKKFIKFVEDLEAQGKSLFKIRDFLERTEERADEPKANVNTEGMDAVKIMTIHGAKGLEFPIVFVPGLDEAFFTKANDSLIYDSGGKLFFKYAPQSAVRKVDEDFILHSKKEEEEQKRLFYVAVTRAEAALFLTGRWSENNSGFLGLLKQGLGLQKTEHGRTRDERREMRDERGGMKTEHGQQWEITGQLKGFSILSGEEIEALYKKTPVSRSAAGRDISRQGEFIPIEIKEPLKWKSVTEAVDIRRRHGKDWAVLGDIIHRLFEVISKGFITEQGIEMEAERLLSSKGVLKGQREEFLSIIGKDISILKEKGIWQNVILPQEHSFSELPFIFESGQTVYTGRIDRVIKEGNVYKVYDYKTFPVDKKEIEYLLKGYSFQLNIYRSAVKKIFKAEDAKSFIVFTHIGEVREVF